VVLERFGLQALRGFFMGAADIVPGVSGGTIALLVGIYDDLVQNVRAAAGVLGRVARGDIAAARSQLRSVDWAFLVPLGVGILIAVAALASVIERLLEDYPEEMAGLFFGLVAASIVIAWNLLERRTGAELGLLIAVAVVVFVLLGYQKGPVANPSPIAFLGAGALAICAMILPGISGSFLLLMIGMYTPVLGAVSDRDLGDVLLVGVGVVIGLALFSNVLGVLLDRARDLTLAALVGLMVGSLRVLWPWPNGVGLISREADEVVDGTGLDWPNADDAVMPIVLAVVAFAVVFGISRVAAKRETGV